MFGFSLKKITLLQKLERHSWRWYVTLLFNPGVPFPVSLIPQAILAGFLYTGVAACFGFRGDFVGPFHLWHTLVAVVVVWGVAGLWHLEHWDEE